jgi:pteridine reductase
MPAQTAHSTQAQGLAIVTGGSKRIGAAIVRELHGFGWDVLIHAHRSVAEAQELAAELTDQRPDSARVVTADLCADAVAEPIFGVALDWHPQGATLLVNNASSYYPTPLGNTSAKQWEDLRRSNLDAPLWLSQAFVAQAPVGSSIINLVDAMLPHGIPGYAAYAAAKAGLENLTRSLARELAPHIRVNAVAPGAILWPEPEPTLEEQQAILDGIPLGRVGHPEDIAQAVQFLASAPYITGHILAVDGGRSL